MSDWKAESAARKAAIQETIARLGLYVESAFIPFSQSRNKAEKNKSLNWRVTISRNGRDILSCDYSAGIAHCPGYAAKRVPAAFKPAHYKKRDGGLRFATAAETLAQYRESVCAEECESGFPMECDGFALGTYENVFKRKYKAAPIRPDSVDVIYSLVMDSDVLSYSGFDDWAESLGFDTDSRKAESIWKECIGIALSLRAAIGDSGMNELKTAFEDY